MVRSFIIFQSGEKLTSFTKNNRANFSVKKKTIKNNHREAFRGVCQRPLDSRTKTTTIKRFDLTMELFIVLFFHQNS